MGNTSINLEWYAKVKNAAYFEVDKNFNTITIPNLIFLLGQRKVIAKFLIDNHLDNKDPLYMHYDVVNHQIKELLGL